MMPGVGEKATHQVVAQKLALQLTLCWMIHARRSFVASKWSADAKGPIGFLGVRFRAGTLGRLQL